MIDMAHIRLTRHSYSRRNVHHAARTKDDMEVYDGMESVTGPSYAMGKLQGRVVHLNHSGTKLAGRGGSRVGLAEWGGSGTELVEQGGSKVGLTEQVSLGTGLTE
ncbi:hypothetical protein BHE74_00014093 [Ensete ventricosum]|nr:hypothetical protein BHE74_00014093 [Ensete ventricosum]